MRPLVPICLLAIALFSPTAEAALGSAVPLPHSVQERAPVTGAEPLLPPLVRKGRILAKGPLAEASNLVLTLERSEGDPFAIDFGNGMDAPKFGTFEWAPVKKVPIAEDGTFSAALPHDAPYVRFVARGRFALGIAPFELNGTTDPGEDPLDLSVFVGGEITLQLRVDGEATEEERRSLVGRRVKVAGSRGFMGSSYSDWPSEGGTMGEFTRMGEIDDELRVVLPHLPFVEVQIVARGEGDSFATGDGEAVLAPFYAPPALQLRAEPGKATQAVVRLRRAVQFSGSVVDASGQPIAGATLDTESGAGTPLSLERSRSTTDEKGRFQVDGLAREPKKVTVYAQGFLPTVLEGALVSGVGGEGDALLTVRSGAVLRVKVVAPGGRPAHGIRLTVTDPGGGRHVKRQGTTDSQGIATFDLLSGEPVAISGAAVLDRKHKAAVPSAVGAPPAMRFRAPRNPDFAVRAGSGTELWVVEADSVKVADEPLELELRHAPRVRGLVEGIDPAQGATRVIVAHEGEHSSGYGLSRGQLASLSLQGEDNGFTFQLPPGSYHIAATQGRGGEQSLDMAKLRATPHVDVDVDADAAGQSDIVVLDFGLAMPMEGVVRFADGRAAAGLTVRLTRRIGGYSDASTSAVTDADGAFRSIPLLAGRYSVHARSEDGLVTARDFDVAFDPAEPQPVELDAVGMGWVQVNYEGDWRSVRRASQTPIPYWSSIREPEEGGGRVGPVHPGRYGFALEVVHPDGSVTMRGKQIQVEEGRTTEVELGSSEIALAKIEGRVLSGGEPVPGVRVSAHLEKFDLAWDTTDLEGRYALAVDAEGPIELRLGTLLRRKIARRPAVAARGARSDVDVQLPTGAIHVTLETPLANHEWLRLRRLGPDASGDVERSLGSHSGGSSAFVYLEDGRYGLERINWTREITARAEVKVTGGAALRNVALEPVKD